MNQAILLYQGTSRLRFTFTGQCFQEDKPVDLSKILSICVTEDGIDDANEQPLYIDYERECIACRWCEKCKGSIEVRVINQHVKTAISHEQRRQLTLHPENHPNPLQGVRDIRTYFRQ